MAPAMPYETEKARFNKEKRVIFMSKGEKTRLPLFAFAEIVLILILDVFLDCSFIESYC